MKLYIVIEIDTWPDATLLDVTALVQPAVEVFKRAVVPIGSARLVKIKGALPAEFREVGS